MEELKLAILRVIIYVLMVIIDTIAIIIITNKGE